MDRVRCCCPDAAVRRGTSDDDDPGGRGPVVRIGCVPQHHQGSNCQMEVVTCPEELVLIGPIADYPSVFLGGGISNCPDWQNDIIAKFAEAGSNVVLVNPRRSNFDITNPDMSKQQIGWEYNHLKAVDGTLFWFPCETLCPITLFELAKQAALGRRIFVGCHPNYARKFDVEEQLRLMGFKDPVVDNLDDLVAQVVAWEKEWWA